jgi:hypothetical protein
VLLTLISLAFAAIGVWIIRDPDVGATPGDQMMGWAVLALFGACAVIGVSQLLTTRAPQPDALGATTLRPAPFQSIALIIGGLGMAIGCALLVPFARTDGDWLIVAIGAFGAVFFGLCALVGVWRVMSAKPIMRLEREGLQVFGAKPWRAAWRDITAIEPFQVFGQHFLGLRVSPAIEAAFPNHGRIDRTMGFPRFSISASLTGIQPAAFEAMVRDYWRQGQ